MKTKKRKSLPEFKKYRRTVIVEMRPVTEEDIESFHANAGELIVFNDDNPVKVLIYIEDLATGSPKIGDMIARNKDNHDDQILISEEYFKNNYEFFLDER